MSSLAIYPLPFYSPNQTIIARVLFQGHYLIKSVGDLYKHPPRWMSSGSRNVIRKREIQLGDTVFE